MLLPIGLDETRVSRLPWVSIAIVVLNVGAFVATSVSGADRAARAQLREAIAYWAERPHLAPPPELESHFGITRERLERVSRAAPPAGRARSPGAFTELEQKRLDALVAAAVEAHEAIPERRWSLVPARGLAQVGWLTHLFMHAGIGHLAGNMLVFFLVVAPFLEDAWGRPFFTAFYLAGGLFAGACQALPMGSSSTHILGASGAISACLGAFALRFAHRRVRIFYWFALFFRGTFFVPVWAYALLGAALDVIGLKLAGTGGGVAYAAHLGGFAFGLAGAAAVRATRLEERIAPEGSVRWQGSMAMARAADALAAGRASEARSRLRAIVAGDPRDEAAALELARLEAAALDGAAVRPLVERLAERRLAVADGDGARALLDEFGVWLDPAMTRPAFAYRAGELLERSDPERAARFLEAAAAPGGTLGAKALLRAALLLRGRDAAHAASLAARAAALEGAPLELAARARQIAAELEPRPPAVDAPAALLRAGAPVRVLACHLVRGGSDALHLVTAEGRRAVLPAARVEALAVGMLDVFGSGPGARRNAVVADLLVRGDPAKLRTVVRIPGHAMALSVVRPDLAPRDAFAALVDGLLAASGAVALPGPEAAAGRPFCRFADVAAFEEACYGRRLAPDPAA